MFNIIKNVVDLLPGDFVYSCVPNKVKINCFSLPGKFLCVFCIFFAFFHCSA